MAVLVRVEVPEELHQVMVDYLRVRPDWDLGRLMVAAASLFVLQSGSGVGDRRAARIYLQALFGRPVGQEVGDAKGMDRPMDDREFGAGGNDAAG